MAGQTFAQIMADADKKNMFVRRTANSIEWFQDEAETISKLSKVAYLNNFDKRDYVPLKSLGIGQLYLFFYDPKHKQTLPYYDKFPCIFPISMYDDGSFLGINLHYLPYAMRAKLMDALMTIAKKPSGSKQTKLEISYSILAGAAKFKLFKPCVKRYLPGHVRSKFLLVPYSMWENVAFLPVHQFAKASAQKVWADSLRKM
jgi:hypothetical protein